MERFNLRFKILVINVVFVLFAPFSLLAEEQPSVEQNNASVLFDSSITYYSSGLYKKGVSCLDSIIKIKSQMGQGSYPEFYKVYNMYGVIYKAMGLFEKTEVFYQKALSFPLPTKDRARIFMNLGNLYLLKGDFNSAITYYNKVQSLISAMDYPRLLANSYYNMGLAYDNTSQDVQALKYLLLSIDTRKEAGLSEDGETILLCASSCYKNGLNDTAELYFQKAIDCFHRTVGINHYSTALAYNNYARLLVEKGEYAQALGYYNKCQSILDKSVSEKHIYKSYCFQNLGDLYDRLTDYKKALAYYQKALIAKVNNFNDTSTYSNPVNSTIADIKMLYLLKSKAFTFERLSQEENEEKNLVAAFNTLELNVKLTEQLRSGYLYEASKLKLSENEDDTYKALVRFAAKLYEKTGEQKYAEAAFKYSEKGKYGILREFYNEETQMKAASIPDSLYEKQKAIRERLNGLRFQIEEENSLPKPGEGKLKSLREQLFEETQKLEAISKSLENNYPDYARLKYQDNVCVKDFQVKLRKEQAAFEYAISDSVLYTFFISKDNFKIRKERLDSNFYENLEYYKDFLSGFDWHDYDSFRIAAYSLYQIFLQPFENEIKEKSLLIIPDKDFALISFESLVDEPYKKVALANYAHEPYIIRKYPIGYAFSANLYVESLKKTSRGRNKVLAIAPNYKIIEDSTLSLPFLNKHLRRLTFMSGKFYNKEEASETNLKNAISDYNIIHIYAHGNEDINNPVNSCIVLDNANNPADDGKLYVHEIGGLKINAKLVVLASCYSGSGKISDGEGVLSFGRSFSKAGASSLIISLWYNYLDVSIEQIGTFQKYLLLGKRKDKALQLAKLKYLENANELSGHPKEWASLVIMGNQEPLYQFFVVKALLVILACFSVLYLVVRSFLRKEK